MRRLVYSPKAYAYIQTEKNGIVNLSDYIVSGSVARKVDMASSAELVIRNPDMIWTKGAKRGNPVFRPMDPITVWLQRLRGHPVQVFTGYLDRAPYLQLYPGTTTLAASCTLKRLIHTYWDPALPFTNQFMAEYGWMAQPNGMIINTVAERGGDKENPNIIQKLKEADKVDPIYQEVLLDGSIGRVLFAVLKHVAEWDPKAIHIEQLPPQLIERVGEIYNAYNEDAKIAKGQVEAFLKRIIGEGSYGEGGGGGAGRLKGGTNIERAYNFFRDTVGFTENQAAGAVGSIMGESRSLDPKVTQIGGGGGYGICQWGGGRKEALLAKPNHDTLQVQLRFIYEELKGAESASFKAMKGARSVEAACRTWTSEYERPGIPRINERIAFAHAVKKSFGGGDNKRELEVGGPDTVNIAASQPRKKRISANPDIAERERADDGTAEEKIYAPIKGSPPMGAGAGSDFGPRNVPGGSRNHMGIDVPVSAGTPCIAPFDGEVSVPAGGNSFGGHGGMIHLRAIKDVAGLKRGQIIGWGHIQSARVKSGRVKAGQHIADSGWHHVHFVLRDGPGAPDGTLDPEPVYKALSKGEEAPASGSGSDDGDTGGTSYDDILSVSKAAAFVQQMEWSSAQEQMEAVQQFGPRSLMNDKPLFPFIQQLSKASMRSFQSMPNGNFYAFYPDYFGQFDHRKPYWTIDDVEILDAQIELSDEALATHVFAVGDTIPAGRMGEPSAIGIEERIFTTGIVNIYNVTQSGFNPDPGPGDVDPKKAKEIQKDRLGRIATDPTQVIAFLKKYGARPHIEEAEMIRSPYFEHFIAYQTFQLLWSRMFLTAASFTFMPELYPGGLVAFGSHGLQCYIDEVTHTFDYENGFTTDAQLSAPASLDSDKLATDPLSFGLVRASAHVGFERRD